MVSTTPEPATEKPATLDWEGIERDYRAGLLSVREIGAANRVSHSAILKRAKRDGWDRDLAAKVRARAEAKVAKAAVTTPETAATKATEEQIIEANAEVIARVRLSHRTDINRYRKLANQLMTELEQQTQQVPELADLGKLMYRPDDKGIDKLNELYQKVISLPVRTKTMKDLGDTLKTLIGLEREANGIGQGKDDTPPVRELSDEELETRMQRYLGKVSRPTSATLQ